MVLFSVFIELYVNLKQFERVDGSNRIFFSHYIEGIGSYRFLPMVFYNGIGL